MTTNRYGATALRRAAKTAVDCAAVKKNLGLLQHKTEAGEFKELPTDPRSSVSGLTALGHLKEIKDPFPDSIVDLLYSYPIDIPHLLKKRCLLFL